MRDTSPVRYQVKQSELFDAGLKQLLKKFPSFENIYLSQTWSFARDPTQCGEPSTTWDGLDCYVAVTPPVKGVPPIRISYQVTEKDVILWTVGEIADVRA